MTKKRFLITTLIITVLGIGAGISLGCLDGSEIGQIVALSIFCPIWFIGIYFCVFPIRKRLPWVLAFEAFRMERRRNKNDKYDICANLIGGLVLAFILTLGWFIGLIKFLVYLYRIIRYGDTRREEQEWKRRNTSI